MDLMRGSTLVALLMVAALLMTACGGPDHSDQVASLEDASTTTSTTLAFSELEVDEEAAIAFSQCMRDQGLDFPDPTVDADGNLRMGELDLQNFGATPEEIQQNLQRAFDACSDYLGGVTFGAVMENMTALEDRFLEFAACVREHGYDMADPDFTTASGFIDFGDLDLDDPAFQAALEACRHVFTDFQPSG
jgi:hypothetical protein